MGMYKLSNNWGVPYKAGVPRKIPLDISRVEGLGLKPKIIVPEFTPLQPCQCAGGWGFRVFETHIGMYIGMHCAAATMV